MDAAYTVWTYDTGAAARRNANRKAAGDVSFLRYLETLIDTHEAVSGEPTKSIVMNPESFRFFLLALQAVDGEEHDYDELIGTTMTFFGIRIELDPYTIGVMVK